MFCRPSLRFFKLQTEGQKWAKESGKLQKISQIEQKGPGLNGLMAGE